MADPICCWVYASGPRQLHAGVAYRADDDGTVAFLHLAWENAVCDRDPQAVWFWAAPALPREKLLDCARRCAVIWRRYAGRPFPYAMGLQGSSFDRDGTLVLPNGATGLTCASFVVALFKGAGVEFIDEDTWPTRTDEDRDWLQSLPQHDPPLSRLQADVEAGRRRVRPAELLAAVETPPYPVSFHTCWASASQIEAAALCTT